MQDKTRRGKIKQGKAGLDKQENTRQGKATEHKTRQGKDNTRQV